MTKKEQLIARRLRSLEVELWTMIDNHQCWERCPIDKAMDKCKEAVDSLNQVIDIIENE